MFYFDIFEQKRVLHKDIIEVAPYEGIFADIYDCYAVNEGELEIYSSECMSAGRDVLELCCGTGRIAIPLAQKGLRVHGVDASLDMLAIFSRKIKSMVTGVQKRISFTRGDIFKMEFCGKYNSVILPATTICILSENRNLLLKLINEVYDVLETEGKFIFDCILYKEDQQKSKGPAFSESIVINGVEGTLLMGDFIDYVPGRVICNLYFEVVLEGEAVRRYISYTNKKKLTRRFIDQLISESKFSKCTVQELKANYENFLFYILEK
ncbi:MAG: class I SAM-dependent methyltransferase [Synergistaceae bacterium]|nr:class I SAM-dependent methyltransferase [Synergistaceae bacterium]